jgi:transcriptional regulator with XRE-family HTH domain
MMTTLGERIRELREEQDLSLRELAGKIGVSAAFLSDVELNRRYPSDKHLGAIAQHLGAELADLQQYDTRPPVRELRKAALSDPQYGFAFRQMMDKQVSAKEILEFIENRDRDRKGQ